MKEIGIIMSGNHPKLILDGIKTQTRRTYGLSLVNDPPQSMADWQKVAVFQDGLVRFATPDGNGDVTLVCPYGGVGDRLWVRESYEFYRLLAGKANIRYTADNLVTWVDKPEDKPTPKKGIHPSIHLPHWASRITLEIIEVRVERLQEITEEDAIAEGCIPTNNMPFEPRFIFLTLWNSLNAKRGYGWTTNPWVWVINFRRLDT